MRPQTASNRPKFVVDGLNVCRYRRASTELSPLLTLLVEVARLDPAFLCAFDGVTPHRLKEDERRLYEQLLNTLPDQFIEITGGIEADEFILMQADVASARVISNDRFKKYLTRYRWLDDNERLIKGHLIRNEVFLPGLGIATPLWVDLGEAADRIAIMLSNKHDAKPTSSGETGSKLRRYRRQIEDAEIKDLMRGD